MKKHVKFNYNFHNFYPEPCSDMEGVRQVDWSKHYPVIRSNCSELPDEMDMIIDVSENFLRKKYFTVCSKDFDTVLIDNKQEIDAEMCFDFLMAGENAKKLSPHKRNALIDKLINLFC